MSVVSVINSVIKQNMKCAMAALSALEIIYETVKVQQTTYKKVLLVTERKDEAMNGCCNATEAGFEF